MKDLSKELYDAIIQKRLEEGPVTFTIDGTEYALVSGYAPMYTGFASWEYNTEMIVCDRDGNMFHLTLWTDKYDYGCPTEYHYELRFFYDMSENNPESYFK